MKNSDLSKRLPQLILASCCATYIIAYCAVAILRLRYPFELEWMEGGSVDHVRRILSGEGIYIKPSLEFIPYGYTPLYYYVAAVVASITKIGFLPLRLVSFISSLGCFYTIFLIVRRETGRRFSGLMAASLFAATFQISGAWFDIARVDSLYLFLLLLGIYSIRFPRSAASYAVAGLLISLSFLTKQSALVVALFLIPYAMISNFRGCLIFTFTVTIVIGLTTLLFNRVSDGWYYYYVFKMAGGREIDKRAALEFWTHDILRPLSIACAVSSAYILAKWKGASDKPGLFYSLTALGMICAGWIGRMQAGGYNNALFPAYAAIAVLFGVGTGEFLDHVKDLPAGYQHRSEMCLYLFCALQFLGLIYNPRTQIPKAHDLDAGRYLVGMMASTKGEILLHSHGYLSAMAGKRTYAQEQAVCDVLQCRDRRVKEEALSDIEQAMRSHRFSTIILDRGSWLEPYVKPYYVQHGRIFGNEKVFWPVTGGKTRPETIWIPKQVGKLSPPHRIADRLKSSNG
jgi:hypothetical protein